MGAKWFCNRCEKEIWKNMTEDQKKATIEGAERICFCSDCILIEIQSWKEEDMLQDQDYLLEKNRAEGK